MVNNRELLKCLRISTKGHITETNFLIGKPTTFLKVMEKLPSPKTNLNQIQGQKTQKTILKLFFLAVKVLMMFPAQIWCVNIENFWKSVSQQIHTILLHFYICSTVQRLKIKFLYYFPKKRIFSIVDWKSKSKSKWYSTFI